MFHYSFGYDQTNCEFYQVVGIKGKYTVIMKRIAGQEVEGSAGFMSCQLKPVKDAFITGNMAETITKRVSAGYNGEPRISMPYGGCSRCTEDQSFYSSWYA